jgi:carboxypeptidase Taq
MSIDKIRKHLEEYSYLKSLHSLLYWDMETMMPKGAIEDRAKRLSYIQGKLHSHITGKKYISLLEDLKNQKLKPLERKLAKELLYDYELQAVLPLKHVMELSHASSIASHAWAEARKSNDWKSFSPHLEKLIDLKKVETKFYEAKKPYDALIKLHDREFDSAKLTVLFQELKTGLIKLRDKVEEEGSFVKVKDLKGPFDIEAQKALSERVSALFGLPKEFSRLDISAHPFSINISPKDQRITTRYVTQNIDSLSSTMHEVGHALYEHQLPAEWEGTPFQEAISLSVHESQSRFWENVIGRSREFSEFIHPEMVKTFPKAMKNVDPEELFRVFNKSVPGLIRVESPELYYNLHVIIRFEIEEAIFNGNVPVSELPKLWNDKYKSYLGIRPKTYAEGILQDSHWAGGAFGYFPTYTLGNLISGSLSRIIREEMKGYNQLIRKGDFSPIREWLKENIHRHGRSISARDIVGEIQVKDYLTYLGNKFRS